MFGVPDLHASTGCPSGSYTPDFAAEIDGDDPQGCADEYRRGYIDGCKRGYHLMNQWAWLACHARNPLVVVWQIATALGLTVADSKTDDEIAAICGVKSRACISKGRIEFQRANGIKPMPRQKSESARNSYRSTRKSQVHAN